MEPKLMPVSEINAKYNEYEILLTNILHKRSFRYFQAGLTGGRQVARMPYNYYENFAKQIYRMVETNDILYGGGEGHSKKTILALIFGKDIEEELGKIKD